MTDPTPLLDITDEFLAAEATIRTGGGAKAIERHHAKGRLTARERVALLIDSRGARDGAGDGVGNGVGRPLG